MGIDVPGGQELRSCWRWTSSMVEQVQQPKNPQTHSQLFHLYDSVCPFRWTFFLHSLHCKVQSLDDECVFNDSCVGSCGTPRHPDLQTFEDGVHCSRQLFLGVFIQYQHIFMINSRCTLWQYNKQPIQISV